MASIAKQPEQARDRELLIALGKTASLEMGIHDRSTIAQWAHLLQPGTRINITAFPNQLATETAETARLVRAAGFQPIPHIAARRLASAGELHDLLGRLQGEAATDEVFLIAGDRSEPVGPFAAVADLLRTEALGNYGVARVGVAGHPEGHPRVADGLLRQAEAQKVELARSLGLELRFITQFTFAAAPIVNWLSQLRANGIPADVSIGIAGPARLTTLLKFAARCGVGASVSALGSRIGSMSKLIGDRRPDTLVRELGQARAAGTVDFQTIHFFAFGGVGRTCRWIHDLSEGKFKVTQSGGFQLQGEAGS